MSELKIIGNPDPIVGKEEFYAVNSNMFNVLPFQNAPTTGTNYFDLPVKWEVYILENGTWRKTKENDKTGNKVSYTFMQKSLQRKGIRILAKKGDQTARLDIKAHPANAPKINSIELLDKSGKKPSKPLSYGQTLKARIHCLHMDNHKVYASLWEEAAAKGEKNASKEKNIIITLSSTVKKGVADIDFVLRPSAGNIAKLKSKNEIHEYFVTSAFDPSNLSSNKVDVNVLETPIAPFRGKAPVNQNKAKTTVPTKVATGKSEITKVHITDTAGHDITGVFKDKQIKVWIDSIGLIGKEIRLKLYDKDYVADDLLANAKITIKSNIFSASIFLDRIPLSSGGDTGEGDQQELFADIEVLQSGKHSISKEVNVDSKVFKPDPVEENNTVSKIWDRMFGSTSPNVTNTDEEQKEEGVCPNCDKDITLAEIKKICVDGKDKCLITDDAMIIAALPHLNKYRKKVKINTCVRKAHFLAQIAQESNFQSLQENFNWYWQPLIGTFKSYFIQFRTQAEKETEAKRLGRANKASKPELTLDQQIKLANAIYGSTHPNGRLHTDANDGWRYSGKGFKQITWKSNYDALQKYFNANMKIDNEADVVWVDGDNPYKLKNDAKDAMTSALAYWSMNGINRVADSNTKKAVEKVTLKINTASKGLKERKKFYVKAVKALDVNKCKIGKEITIEDGTVIIVSGSDTKIEKDPGRANLSWVMYKTSVYTDMKLETYKKLLKADELPKPDFITYLSRDTHQFKSSDGTEIYKHSDKRFGQYNEIPVGEYYLKLATRGQKYLVYVVDSKSKSASAEDGIAGVDGDRGGVAIHQYSPRFSVGCFTFNCGKSTSKVEEFLAEIPDLKDSDKDVRFIIEKREVSESEWADIKYGTTKWTGI